MQLHLNKSPLKSTPFAGRCLGFLGSFTISLCMFAEESDKTNAPSEPAPQPSQEEKETLQNFNKEFTAVMKWAKEDVERRRAEKPAQPAAVMLGMFEVSRKLRAIKTDGLPAEFKTAWDNYVGALGELTDLYEGMPKPQTSGEDLKNLVQIMPKVKAVQAKIGPAQKTMFELGMKLGIFDKEGVFKK